MPMKENDAKFVFDEEAKQYQCTGKWSVSGLDGIMSQFLQSHRPEKEQLNVCGKGLTYFDSAGALALFDFVSKLEGRGNQVNLKDFTKTQMDLLSLVKKNREALSYHVPPEEKEKFLPALGRETIRKLNQADGLVILIGDLSAKIFEAFGNWRRFQFPSIVSIIASAGVGALPIVALLSFLIGVVLAYQMGLQLETYGANIFIAYLSGMAIFREFGPLITAIIVAGRTSSAFTAQIGSMKINEEVDAILTMGLSPTQLLVMPKVIGLLLVFPLLIFWSDIFSVLGSMVMSKGMLHIGYIDFLNRLKDSVGIKHFMLGLYKAPAFALLIALVGCFQGFKVEASADSVGSQTTKSVVQALFLIIFADAAFSVVYSWMGV